MRSTIVRDNTDALVAVRPEAVMLDIDDLSTERERVLAAGHAEGYAAGLAAARRLEAQNEANRTREQYELALVGLAEAASKCRAAFGLERHGLEGAAVELGFGIAKAVLARELKLSCSPGEQAIKRALAELRTSERIVARLNPSDIKLLGECTVDGVPEIIADPTIGPGGCELESGDTLIDARIETALDRVRRVLDEATATVNELA